ncbi:MAG: electron transfer flavoprotein subunit beta/FixA family protein [Proteobacteria bacterium]|nr:electron transfer flavoprotein subunit beta/FixA family protein [Pseudomonadota bacterium]
MKILVGFKRVIDYNITARPNAQGTAVELSGVKMSPNPFDEIALEQAVKLKEQGLATEVVALSIGDAGCAETLRTALAMGADRALHVKTDGTPDALSVAKAFAQVAKDEGVKLVLLGKQAIDTDHGQTPSMVAELLGWPQALNAFKMELTGDDAKVTSEIDGGLETFAFKLPAVVSVDLRLNTPRFVSMPAIIKARSKPIEEKTVDGMAATRVTVKSVFTPKQERKQVMVETLDDLLKHLEARA